jgi:hypothetical protein
MSLAQAVAKIEESIHPALESVARQTPANIAELPAEIPDVKCSAAEFEQWKRQLSGDQAAMLLTATLHRCMAYAVELLPLQEARSLAGALITAAGPGATHFSKRQVDDEVSGIGGWSFMVTSHTFESILYGEGRL